MRPQEDARSSEQRAYYSSPIGTIEIIGNRRGLLALRFLSKDPPKVPPVPPSLRRALREIDEYFKGRRTKFALELILQGTEFQTAVWRRLMEIPWGETRSYGEIARAVRRPKAVRAVGAANAANPIGIVIPCHRVIGSDGRLTGYGGGLWRKRWLLDHERKSARRGR